MPEDIIPQLKVENPAKALEADMDRLAGEILKHKENPEMAGADDREIVRQALRSIGPLPATTSAAPVDSVSPYLPQYAADAPAGTKLEIEYLVEKALKEGIREANSLASKSNPFVLDAFHDALTGKLYPELKKRNLVD